MKNMVIKDDKSSSDLNSSIKSRLSCLMSSSLDRNHSPESNDEFSENYVHTNEFIVQTNVEVEKDKKKDDIVTK